MKRVEAGPCGACWSDKTIVEVDGTVKYVKCMGCGMQGPYGNTEKEAIAVWDELAQAIERGNR